MKHFEILTALITPFEKDGTIDYAAFQKIIQMQLAQGIDGFIVCGTTAEVSCLKEYEMFDILRFVLNEVRNKVKVYFGCGKNNTAETIHLVKKASYYDISGILLVTPYYNKPSQQGLLAHFSSIAKVTHLPIMLYQVPSRCGICLEKETLYQLFQSCENIVALKHASDDYSIIKDLHQQFPNVNIYSGEDKTFFEGMDKGMQGLISVSSHYTLPLLQEYRNTKNIDLKKQIELLADCTFLECSPCAIKYILSKFQICQEFVRLPLVPLLKQNKEKIDSVFKENNFDKIYESFLIE